VAENQKNSLESSIGRQNKPADYSDYSDVTASHLPQIRLQLSAASLQIIFTFYLLKYFCYIEPNHVRAMVKLLTRLLPVVAWLGVVRV